MAQYLITVAFAHETVEIEHKGSLKDGLKAVWSLAAERKAEPFDIRFAKERSDLMRRRTVGRPSVRLNQCEINPITPYAKRPTMHDEGEDIMETINWLVAGKNSMEMHGYTNSDSGNDPTIKVMTSASGTWTFTFRDIVGTGRIQVSAGADYNPLDLNRISVSARQVFDKRDKQQIQRQGCTGQDV